MRQFLQLFAEKFIETSKHGSLFEKLQVLTKSMIFRAFSRNQPLFPTFSLKVHGIAKTCQFFRKVASFDQIHDFSCFLTKRTTFSNLFLKGSSKYKNMVVCSKSCIVLAKSMISRAFSRMRHFLHLPAKNFMKMPRHGSLLEKLQLLAKSMVFRAFSRNEALFATFYWKVHGNAKTW